MSKTSADLFNKLTPATAGKSVKDVLVSVKDTLAKNVPALTAALGGKLSPEKFSTIVNTYVRNNAHLWECDPNSIVSSAIQAAELGLSFSIRNEAFMVPYKGKATFQAGYKGIAKLALNHPHVQSLVAYPVFTNDEFEVVLGAQPDVVHKPTLESRGDLRAFYAVARDYKGNVIPEVMTVSEVEAWAAQHIKAAGSGPFAEVKAKGRRGANFEAYGLKTVLLRLCNRKLPMSEELSQVIENEFETKQDALEREFSEPDRPTPVFSANVQPEPKEVPLALPETIDLEDDELLSPNI